MPHFGRLVRVYRERQGCTGAEVALKALGDAAKRARLSDLENGKVKKPHAKIVNALVDFFDMAEEEVEACRREPEPPPSADLPPDTGLPTELLENLAQRFGIDNPDQPPAALAAFLKEKAKDYRQLKADMAALPKSDERVANVRAAAEEAIARGDFEEARARLDDAVEIEIRDHALVSAQKAAGLLNLKAKSHLLEGDADAAAASFQRGAEMVRPFDEVEFARLQYSSAIDLYKHGLRYGGTGLVYAIAAYEAALEVRTRAEHPVDWAMTQENLALTFEELAGLEAVRARDHLSCALEHVCKSLEVFDPDHMPFNFEKASKARDRIKEKIAALR